VISWEDAVSVMLSDSSKGFVITPRKKTELTGVTYVLQSHACWDPGARRAHITLPQSLRSLRRHEHIFDIAF